MNTLFSTNEAHHTLISGVYFVVSAHDIYNRMKGKMPENEWKNRKEYKKKKNTDDSVRWLRSV